MGSVSVVRMQTIAQPVFENNEYLTEINSDCVACGLKSGAIQ